MNSEYLQAFSTTYKSRQSNGFLPFPVALAAPVHLDRLFGIHWVKISYLPVRSGSVDTSIMIIKHIFAHYLYTKIHSHSYRRSSLVVYDNRARGMRVLYDRERRAYVPGNHKCSYTPPITADKHTRASRWRLRCGRRETAGVARSSVVDKTPRRSNVSWPGSGRWIASSGASRRVVRTGCLSVWCVRSCV